MWRKRLTLFSLLLAQIIIWGHGVVPHHHDFSSHHHHASKDHSHGHEQSPIELGFTGLFHVDHQITFVHNPESFTSLAKKHIEPALVKISYHPSPVPYLVAFQKHTFPPDRSCFYTSPLNYASPLRGPPDLIVV